MASSAYYAWVGDGRPYRLCRPAAALQAALRAHGLTVYDYPDDAHLTASTPEDHTPFSATGWPSKSAYGIGHAIDIMPRADTAAGRAENAAIARRLIADRNAGVPGVAWIKYMNWTDEQGVCRQERWMPSHATRSSTDRGHIHISARSDCDTDARADTYDPTQGDDMYTDDDRMRDQQTHAIARAMRWMWQTDRDGFLEAGGVAAVWDYAGGMGDNDQAAQVAQLVTAATADKARDDALAAAVKALAVGAGADPQAVFDAIERAVAAAVQPLRAQVVDLQARLAAVGNAAAGNGAPQA